MPNDVIAGFHVSAGKAYVSLVTCGGALLDIEPYVFESAVHLEPEQALVDLSARIAQTLRPHSCLALALMGTSKGTWTYSEARTRVLAEAAVMAAAANEGIPYRTFHPATARKKANLSGADDGRRDALARLGLQRPRDARYWNDGRGLASVAALAAAEEFCG